MGFFKNCQDLVGEWGIYHSAIVIIMESILMLPYYLVLFPGKGKCGGMGCVARFRWADKNNFSGEDIMGQREDKSKVAFFFPLGGLSMDLGFFLRIHWVSLIVS